MTHLTASMFSHHKNLDKRLYQEVILMMVELVKYKDNPVAMEALVGFDEYADKLKHKIETHDYAPEDNRYPVLWWATLQLRGLTITGN